LKESAYYVRGSKESIHRQGFLMAAETAKLAKMKAMMFDRNSYANELKNHLPSERNPRMLRLQMFRPVAALALATGLFLTMPGCGDNKPPSAKKEDKNTDSPANPSPTLNINQTPNTDSSTVHPPLPPAEKIDLTVGVGKEATDFMGNLRANMTRADQLSKEFVKAIGLPAELAADKAKGYSPDTAEGWLRRVGIRRGLSPLFMSKQVGNVALFRGTFINEPGGYFLRMINEGGAWKVDWLSLTSVDIQGATLNSSNANTVCEEFAVASIVGTLTDKDALLKEDRAVVLAAGMTPALKAKWAEPLSSDKEQGFDYNRGLLMQKAAEFSAGVDSISFVQEGNAPVFRVEISRAGAKKTYIVKLVKGSGPCQMLVDEIAPQ
jgi:hypothetical protein